MSEETHHRWTEKTTRSHADPERPYEKQCLLCSHYLALSGAAGLNWGVCANAASEWDALLRFEHDGCAQFEWGIDQD
jgi:hypothetical protein